jgi:uncharacterized membrane-anchored protein
MRNILLWVGGLAALIFVNFQIVQKEELISNGDKVLLELAPVDPRSLMQGDYMALRYRLANEVGNIKDLPQDGFLVVTLDQNQVAKFKRIHDEKINLAGDEKLLRYRVRTPMTHSWMWPREQTVKIGSNAFFFQEGTAQQYSTARYGEFRVTKNGEHLLIALQDKDFKSLGKKAF